MWCHLHFTADTTHICQFYVCFLVFEWWLIGYVLEVLEYVLGLVCVVSRVCSSTVMDILTSVMVMLVKLSLNIQ